MKGITTEERNKALRVAKAISDFLKADEHRIPPVLKIQERKLLKHGIHILMRYYNQKKD